MTVIRQADLIDSVADALQYISYYHPMDYHPRAGRGLRGRAIAGRQDAIAQILTNQRMCAEGHRPICQDTGIVGVFREMGRIAGWRRRSALQEVVDEGVRRPTTSGTIRCAPPSSRIPRLPARHRRQYADIVHVEMVPGRPCPDRRSPPRAAGRRTSPSSRC